MQLKKNYPWIFWSILITPPLAFLSLTSVLGEGTRGGFFLQLFFPYTYLFFNIDYSILIGFFLYIFYGIIITIAEKYGRKKEAIRIIVISHVSSLLFCIFLTR